jgi:hypothetical protein
VVNTVHSRRSTAAPGRFAVTRPSDQHRPIATRGGPARSAPALAEDADALLYGVIRFEGAHRDARSVVLAFENAHAADEYAVGCGFDDYLVVPLSFPYAERDGGRGPVT